MANLKGIGQPRIHDAATPARAEALNAGTGVFQPLLPNQRRETGDNAGGNGGQQSGSGDPHAALANAILNMGNATMARVSTRLAKLTPRAQGGDNVLRNLNPHGETTFARGSLLPNLAYQRQFNKSTMGRQVRVAGDMPNEWSSQISAAMTGARLNRADPAMLARTLAA
jgi:hypothetical protein